MLEPPPGGVERMRARLAEPRARVAGFKLAAFGVAALIAVVTLTVERDGKPVQAEELPSTDPRVRIYRVL